MVKSTVNGIDTTKIVELFLELRYDNKMDIIYYSIIAHNKNIFYLFMPNFFDICETDKINLFESSLLKASGDLHMVQYFLSSGIDITVDNHFAIKCASDLGNVELVNLLLQYGADACAYNNHPICLASNLSVVEILLRHGADLHAYDDYLLRSVAKTNNTEFAAALISMGANLNSQNGECLRSATRRCHKEMIMLLLERGASINDIELEDIFGAICLGKHDVLKILQDHEFNLFQLMQRQPKSTDDIMEKRKFLNLLVNSGVDLFEVSSMLLFALDRALCGDMNTIDIIWKRYFG